MQATSALVLAALLVSCSHPPDDPGAQSAVPGAALRRLSRAEYDNTIRDLLLDVGISGFSRLPEDAADPFDNDVESQQVSAALIEAAETLAQDIAQKVVDTPRLRDAILPCAPSGPGDAACLQEFVESFAPRALRRPLAADEIERYLAFGAMAREAGDFYTGVRLVLSALLQDVEFLYRVEIGARLPGDAQVGVLRLSDHEVAARLSYFLLGTTPPDALRARADAGRLRSGADLREAAAELLVHPRAVERALRFHALWLGFHQLPHPAELTAALRAETAALLRRVIFEEHGDYLGLFTARQTFLTDKLATHYGIKVQASPAGTWVDYPDATRRGLLAHGSVLSAGHKFKDTSPTQRGLFIRTRLMCETFGPPPPGVDPDNPPPVMTPCKIDKYQQHSSGGCKGCHGRIDPVGFGLERFDMAGRYRTAEEGLPMCKISGAGTIEGVGAFNGPAELGQLLITSGQLEPCLVQKVVQFALGRPVRAEDEALLSKLAAGFAAGHAFDQLLLDLASSDSFLYRREVP